MLYKEGSPKKCGLLIETKESI